MRATDTLSLHDALPIWVTPQRVKNDRDPREDRRKHDARERTGERDRELRARCGGFLFDLGYAAEGEQRDASNRKPVRSEEHTSELQSRGHLVCRRLLEK